MRIGPKGFEVEIDVFGDTDPKKVPASMFHGAVSVDYDSAVRADIAKQAPATCPRYWYIPAVFQCVACKKTLPLRWTSSGFGMKSGSFSLASLRFGARRAEERSAGGSSMSRNPNKKEPNKSITAQRASRVADC